MTEDKDTDYKSLRKVTGKTADLRKLAETCVCFANAQGRRIIIGVEDKETAPPPSQRVNIEDVNKVVKTLRSLTDGVGIVNPEILEHDNGGQYFELRIMPSTRIITERVAYLIFKIEYQKFQKMI